MAGTQAAGKAITLAAAEAKGPLVAAGGLAAGVAGGLALVRRRGRRRAKGFDIASAAERIGALGSNEPQTERKALNKEGERRWVERSTRRRVARRRPQAS